MKRARADSKTGAGPRKRPRVSQEAQVAAAVRKELRKKTDWKYTDTALVATNVLTTGGIASLLTNLARGDAGLDDFEGNVINPQAITFKYYMHTSQVRNVVRVMIFQWFDSVTPVPSGVLQSVVTGLGPISPTLITNKNYIKVLYDHTHQFAPTAGGDTTVTGEGVTDPVTVYIPGKRLKQVRYQSGNNIVQDGNIYLLMISDDLVVPSPQVTYYSRITFSDN